jgi:hypothetical protein
MLKLPVYLQCLMNLRSHHLKAVKILKLLCECEDDLNKM